MDEKILNQFIWGNGTNYLPVVPDEDALNFMEGVVPEDLGKTKKGKAKRNKKDK